MGIRFSFSNHTVYETRMVQALSEQVEISTVRPGCPATIWRHLDGPEDDSSGIGTRIVRSGTEIHRFGTAGVHGGNFVNFTLKKTRREGAPTVLLVRNLQPRLQPFRQMAAAAARASAHRAQAWRQWRTGRTDSWSRRLRYLFKPMQMLDDKSVLLYDACLVSGFKAKRYFEPRGVPSHMDSLRLSLRVMIRRPRI